MSELKDSQAEKANFSLLFLFALFKPSVDWMRPFHTEEGNLLYSVYGFKC